jgi:hypothetical protein
MTRWASGDAGPPRVAPVAHDHAGPPAQLPLPFEPAAFRRRWSLTLARRADLRGACGPVHLTLEVVAWRLRATSHCERCKQRRRNWVLASDLNDTWDLAGDALLTLLLPCRLEDEVPEWPAPPPAPWDPAWVARVEAAWRTATEALAAHAPAALSLCNRLAPEVRRAAYQAMVTDASGRIEQLVAAHPLAAALLAHASPEAAMGPLAHPSPWHGVVEGLRLRDVMTHAALRLGIDCPHAQRRLRWLARALPGDLPPDVVVSAAWAPFPPSDLPATPDDRRTWAHALAFVGADAQRRGATEPWHAHAAHYASRHYVQMHGYFRSMGEWAFRWLDWLRHSGRRPSRARPVRSMLDALLVWCSKHGRAHMREQVRAELDALAKEGLHTLPTPPLPPLETPTARIHPIPTIRALYEEGERMNHCLFTFLDDILAGDLAAYTAEVGGVPTTVLLERDGSGAWSVKEHAGVGNAEAPSESREVVGGWVALHAIEAAAEA